LEDIFSVQVIPGDFNLYLASNKKFSLSPDGFLKQLAQKNIQTIVLNKFHLEYRLHSRWLDWFYDSISDYTKVRKNFDLSPSATFYSIAYWNTIFSPHLEKFFTILDKLNFKSLLIYLLIFGVGLFALNALVPKLRKASIAFAILTTGFVGMSFDLIIIYAYQSFYGFVFSHLALLVTAFMAGLTLGGWLMAKNLGKIKNDFSLFSKIELALIGFCFTAGLLLLCLKNFALPQFSFVFFILSGASGYLVGSEFPLANKIYGQDKSSTRTAGILYALDLGGAWLAALVISVALVPVIGILKTCVLLMILKAISLALVVSSKLR
ncbi:MAG: hypothetical protein Q8Q91_02015, partial [Candidatus Daviesbacteria bacterium]|nr:hypothetical protein [Candidatus Daviesbacteria bacterium]